jgi:hypothetical protein
MEAFNYYITTLSNAGTKLGPILLACVAAYFLFFRSSASSSKKVAPPAAVAPEKKDAPIIEIENHHEQDEEQRAEYQERLNKARAAREKERAKIKLTPSEILFDLKPGQILNKKVLKKRYYDLLKENHPDKVDSLGSDFKTLAEKKTKEINSAYEELKKKAS